MAADLESALEKHRIFARPADPASAAHAEGMAAYSAILAELARTFAVPGEVKLHWNRNV